MPAEILNTSDRVSLSFDCDLVGLHGLLDLCTNVTQPHVDSCRSDSSVGSLFHCQEELVIFRVEGYCEGTVSHDAAHMSAEVDLHYVIPSQNSIIANVGSPMGRAVVETCACRERNAGIETRGLD